MDSLKSASKSTSQFNQTLSQSSLFSRLSQLDNSAKYRLLVGCGMLFIVATLLALYQPLPKSHARANFEPNHFLYPHENNPELRLPLINADINDLAIVGDKIWLVGSGGLILTSSDFGQCWHQQGAWVKKDELTNDSNAEDKQHELSHLCQGDINGVNRIISSLALIKVETERLSFFPTVNASEKKDTKKKNNSASRTTKFKQVPIKNAAANNNAQEKNSQPPDSNFYTQQQSIDNKRDNPDKNNYNQINPRNPISESIVITGTESNYSLNNIKPISTPNNYYPYFNSVEFADRNFGIAVANDGFIARTKDGGESWQKVGHFGVGDLKAVAIQVTPSGSVGNKIITVGSNGLVLISQNQGDSWQRSSGFNNQSLNDVKIIDDRKIIIVGNNSFASIYEQQENQWRSKNIFFHGNLNSITLDKKNNVLIAGQAGKIFQATLNDLNFIDLETDTQQSIVELTYNGQGTVIAVTEKGGLLRSENNGKNWKPITDIPNNYFSSVSYTDNQQLFAVGRYGAIAMSNDSGINWQMMSRPVLSATNLLTPSIQQYSVSIGYWWYLVTLLCALLVLIIVRSRSENTQASEGIAGIAASDRPLQPGDPDAVHLLGIASDITSFLSNPKTTAPLTLAITGPWGCGKSSLMNLVRSELLKRRFSPVWFNAWHHQKGEQLLASLFAHIKQQAIPSWFSLDGIWFRIKLAVIRGRRHWLIFTFLLFISFIAWTLNKNSIGQFFEHFADIIFEPENFWLIQWDNVIPDSYSAESGWLQTIPALLGFAAPLVAILKGAQGFGLNPEKLISVNHNSKGKAGYDPSARSRFANEFKDVTNALGNNKMVIFIDDLDRCSQENLIEILENINFISSSGDCFLILGMAPKYIKACVANAYQTLANSIAEKEDFENNVIHDPNNADKHKFNFANQYLEKMINIEVNVPCLEEQSIAQMLNQQAIQSKEIEAEIQKLSLKTIMDWFIDHSGPAIKLVLIFSAIYFGIDYGNRISQREIEQTTPQNMVEYSVGYLNQEDLLLLLSSDNPEMVYEALSDVSEKPIAGQQQFPLFVQMNGKSQAPVYKIGSIGNSSDSLNLVVKINRKELSNKTFNNKNNQLNDSFSLKPNNKPTAEPGPPSDITHNENISDNSPKSIVSTSTPAKLQLIPQYAENRISISQLSIAVLLFILWIFYLKKRKKQKFSADSHHFKQALVNWTPWIQLKQQTPRAIKRFLNHLRFRSIRNRKTLSEATLVAAASICFFEKNWLIDDRQFEQLVNGDLEQLLKQKLADEPGQNIDDIRLHRMVVQLQSSLSKEIIFELSKNRLAAVNILSENKPKRG